MNSDVMWRLTKAFFESEHCKFNQILYIVLMRVNKLLAATHLFFINYKNISMILFSIERNGKHIFIRIYTQSIFIYML